VIEHCTGRFLNARDVTRIAAMVKVSTIEAPGHEHKWQIFRGPSVKSHMTVVLKNNNKTPLVIPLAARRKAGFKTGQDLEVKASGGVITIVPKVPNVADEYTPKQRRVVDREIARSLNDVRSGRVHGPFSTHNEFIKSLHDEAKKLSRKTKSRSL
jgi:bifunctional DNA-binding transcriptional regulator/antitoxin component of YhaV-PrlF toxin-antitoxin module